MYILAGESRIDGATVYGETRLYKDLPRPALRVIFGKAPTQTQLDDMLAYDWRLMEGEGENATELSVQSGYCELETHEAVFIQMNALEVENNELKEEVQAVSSAIPTLLKGRDDDVIVEMVKYIPEWVMDKYAIGDVRKDASGYPKICVQAHDSITDPSHDITVASLWAPYHAKSKEHALSWIAPTGAHDIYKKGEYMVYTDGETYECLSDTNYSPDDYAQAWRKYVAEDVPADGGVPDPIEPEPEPNPEEPDPTPGEPEEPTPEEPTPGETEPEPNSNGTEVWSEWKPWTSGLNSDLYQIGDRVTQNGLRYIVTAGNNHWEPASGVGWQLA